MTAHFPTEGYIAQHKLPARSAKAIALRCYSLWFLLIAVAGMVGNINTLRSSLAGYKVRALLQLW